MSEVEIRRIVYGLEQAGLVELIKPPSMDGAVASGVKRPASRAPQVQRTVVTKLIDRIRNI